MDPLEGLNRAQYDAVTAGDGPMLVVAGPGTGKTLTIVRRIAYLILNGTDPSGILAVTFTNRAALEIRERLLAFPGIDASQPLVCTFHVLGLEIMRGSIPGALRVVTRDEQLDLLKGLAVTTGMKAEALLARISRIKNLVEEPDPPMEEALKAYQEALRDRVAYDFDDLIALPLNLLDEPSAAARYRKKFRNILVDEYQDVSPLQYRMLRALAEETRNIYAVGDGDQAIYGFRGADVRNFMDFEKDYASAGRVVLGENYRSTATIVDAAESLIARNSRRIARRLTSMKDGGPKISVVSVPDESSEGRFIAESIERRMGGTSHYRLMMSGPAEEADAPYRFSDFAVLTRTNNQATVIKDALDEWGLPCQIVGASLPPALKMLVEALEAAREGITDLFNLESFLKGLWMQAGLPDDFLMPHVYAAAYSRMPAAAALSGIAGELRCLTAADAFDGQAEAVALMTLHAAKGLEFRTVFIAGVEEGLIPSLKAGEPDAREEERRLFYVGMTRAREELCLLSARARRVFGECKTRRPSSFLGEIPAELCKTLVIGESKRRSRPGDGQMKLFR